jgi:type I restriction enzyme, S subunit
VSIEDAPNRTLPRGWAWVDLDDIGTLYCGQSPPSETVNERGEGTPYVSGPDQWDGSTLRLEKWTTAPRRVVPEGTAFLTVKGAGVGTVFPGVRAAIGRDIYAYMPEPELSVGFVTHVPYWQERKRTADRK